MTIVQSYKSLVFTPIITVEIGALHNKYKLKKIWPYAKVVWNNFWQTLFGGQYF